MGRFVPRKSKLHERELIYAELKKGKILKPADIQNLTGLPINIIKHLMVSMCNDYPIWHCQDSKDKFFGYGLCTRENLDKLCL